MSQNGGERRTGGGDPEAPHDLAPRKARVFIGSSKEGRRVAEAIQLGIADDVDSIIWSQGVFDLSRTPMESLERAAKDYDFAVLVVTPDDPAVKRGQPYMTPRDNVLFEIGLFMGVLGRDRTFVVCRRDPSLTLPTDLAGLTLASFSAESERDLRAALGPTCSQIKNQILKVAGFLPVTPPAPGEAAPSAGRRVARRRRRKALGSARARFPQETHRIADISVSGALLETTGPIPVGHTLDLELELDNREVASVIGEVVRVQEPSWGQVGGVGVAFKTYAGDSRVVIEKYVEADPNAY